MGTDIHFYVERRENGAWVSCDTWEPSEYDDHALIVPCSKQFYDNRNYDLFAMLANVRNGRGFAGITTGLGFNPITEPRGLPNNLSPEMQIEIKNLEHTPSWLLVSELMAYDWTQTTTKRGVVSEAQYVDWIAWRRTDGRGPENYSGGISGPNIKHISEAEMAERVAAYSDDERRALRKSANDLFSINGVYCPVTWTTTYYMQARDFLSETLPRLWRLGKPEDVRCVFWFDS